MTLTISEHFSIPPFHVLDDQNSSDSLCTCIIQTVSLARHKWWQHTECIIEMGGSGSNGDGWESGRWA